MARTNAGADAIIVDLEDSVTIAESCGAARSASDGLENVSRGSSDESSVSTGWRQTMLDLEAAISHAASLAVTKVDSARSHRLIAEVVSELEDKRGMAVGATQSFAMIETPAAWFRCRRSPKRTGASWRSSSAARTSRYAMGMLPTAEAL